MYNSRNLLDHAKYIEQTLRYATRFAAVDTSIQITCTSIQQKEMTTYSKKISMVCIHATYQFQHVVLSQHLKLTL
uniref:Uncharacterized protein n=1 Tax=Babesia bovis TaxID=5865 RepID=S6B3Y4_BABBO|nr:hypothetical protein [Babesia bovis]